MGLEQHFPNLARTTYSVTSPLTPAYNCIAWAAGDSTRWWWPDDHVYWPGGVPVEESLDSFVAAFETLEYEACPDGQLEPGFEKVAIYASADAVPTHAARQLPNGLWTSKLGKDVDIEHELEGLTSQKYGKAVRFLRRPRLQP